jgi:hypothetical protein
MRKPMTVAYNELFSLNSLFLILVHSIEVFGQIEHVEEDSRLQSHNVAEHELSDDCKVTPQSTHQRPMHRSVRRQVQRYLLVPS